MHLQKIVVKSKGKKIVINLRIRFKDSKSYFLFAFIVHVFSEAFL